MVEIIGKPGQLVMLSKSDPMVPEYQREVDTARVKKMARVWDWHLCGVLYAAYRASEGQHYVVDGLQRLSAARLVPRISHLPFIVFDFEGPQHEAEIFVKLQLFRKSLVTRDIQRAELYAAGDFGRIAAQAKSFVDRIDAPLATVRSLLRRFPAAVERVEPTLEAMVGHEVPVHKAFLQGLVYLAHSGYPLDDRVLLDTGYDALHAAQLMKLNEIKIARGKTGIPAAITDQASALQWAIENQGGHLEPVMVNGEQVAARWVPSLVQG